MKEAVSNLLLGDFAESIDRSREVEDIEETVDEIRRNSLAPKLIEWTVTESNPGVVGLFMNMVENVEEVVDQAEETANIIRKIAISRI